MKLNFYSAKDYEYEQRLQPPRKQTQSNPISAQKRRAEIGVNGKRKHLGYFEDEVEAAKAYDKKAVELFGQFAYLNFPEFTAERTEQAESIRHKSVRAQGYFDNSFATSFAK